MNRAAALKVLNPVIAALALSQVLTGIFRDFIPKDAFGTVHKAGGISFAVAAVLHVILNWSWVRASYFAGKPPPGG